jgi:hypothetical protein
VRGELVNQVIRSASLRVLAMMKPVQEVFSEQNPDPELMHMKHLVPRFETIHASMVLEWEAGVHVVHATSRASYQCSV